MTLALDIKFSRRVQSTELRLSHSGFSLFLAAKASTGVEIAWRRCFATGFLPFIQQCLQTLPQT